VGVRRPAGVRERPRSPVRPRHRGAAAEAEVAEAPAAYVTNRGGQARDEQG